jgi:hypothetical protein
VEGRVVGRKRVVEWPIPPKRSQHPCTPARVRPKHFAGCSTAHPRILLRCAGCALLAARCSLDTPTASLAARHAASSRPLNRRPASALPGGEARGQNALDAGTRTSTISKHGPCLYLLSFIASVPSGRLAVIYNIAPPLAIVLVVRFHARCRP